MANTTAQNTAGTVEITADDLPLHCPTPAMQLWNGHPKVYLDVARTGEATCPYCGTHYKLKGGARAGHH